MSKVDTSQEACFLRSKRHNSISGFGIGDETGNQALNHIAFLCREALLGTGKGISDVPCVVKSKIEDLNIKIIVVICKFRPKFSKQGGP